jgi:hypothetical protein
MERDSDPRRQRVAVLALWVVLAGLGGILGYLGIQTALGPPIRVSDWPGHCATPYAYGTDTFVRCVAYYELAMALALLAGAAVAGAAARDPSRFLAGPTALILALMWLPPVALRSVQLVAQTRPISDVTGYAVPFVGLSVVAAALLFFALRTLRDSKSSLHADFAEA